MQNINIHQHSSKFPHHHHHHSINTFLFLLAKWEDGCRFFVVANVIGGVYSLLTLFLPQKSMLWRLVVALDVVIENCLKSI